MKRLINALGLVVLLTGLMAGAAFAQMSPEVVAGDQSGDGTSVVVEKIVSNGPGFIVIHVDEDGAPGEVIGHEAVVDGESNMIPVALDKTVEDGTVLWAMLHTDAGEAGVYEFPGPDGPVQVGDAIVMQSFTFSSAMMGDDDMSDEDMDDEDGMVETTEAPEELPETGAESAPAFPMWLALLAVGFGLLGGAVVLRRA